MKKSSASCSFICFLFVCELAVAISKNGNKVQLEVLCADPNCSEPISHATGSVMYISDEERGLSFKKSQLMTIYSKPVPTDSKWARWEAIIDGKRGLVPPHLVKEFKKLVNTSDLVQVLTPEGKKRQKAGNENGAKNDGSKDLADVSNPHPSAAGGVEVTPGLMPGRVDTENSTPDIPSGPPLPLETQVPPNLAAAGVDSKNPAENIETPATLSAIDVTPSTPVASEKAELVPPLAAEIAATKTEKSATPRPDIELTPSLLVAKVLPSPLVAGAGGVAAEAGDGAPSTPFEVEDGTTIYLGTDGDASIMSTSTLPLSFQTEMPAAPSMAGLNVPTPAQVPAAQVKPNVEPAVSEESEDDQEDDEEFDDEEDEDDEEESVEESVEEPPATTEKPAAQTTSTPPATQPSPSSVDPVAASTGPPPESQPPPVIPPAVPAEIPSPPTPNNVELNEITKTLDLALNAEPGKSAEMDEMILSQFAPPPPESLPFPDTLPSLLPPLGTLPPIEIPVVPSTEAHAATESVQHEPTESPPTDSQEDIVANEIQYPSGNLVSEPAASGIEPDTAASPSSATPQPDLSVAPAPAQTDQFNNETEPSDTIPAPAVLPEEPASPSSASTTNPVYPAPGYIYEPYSPPSHQQHVTPPPHEAYPDPVPIEPPPVIPEPISPPAPPPPRPPMYPGLIRPQAETTRPSEAQTEEVKPIASGVGSVEMLTPQFPDTSPEVVEPEEPVAAVEAESAGVLSGFSSMFSGLLGSDGVEEQATPAVEEIKTPAPFVHPDSPPPQDPTFTPGLPLAQDPTLIPGPPLAQDPTFTPGLPLAQDPTLIPGPPLGKDQTLTPRPPLPQDPTLIPGSQMAEEAQLPHYPPLHEDTPLPQGSPLLPSGSDAVPEGECKNILGLESDCADAPSPPHLLEFFDKKVPGTSYTFLYLVVTAVAVLIFTLGHFFIERTRQDGPLIAKVNQLTHELQVATSQLESRSVSDSYALSESNNEVLAAVQAECNSLKQLKVDLENQLESTQQELEGATEAGLELNRMLSDLLTQKHGSDSLLKSVEQLQGQLNAQQRVINDMNRSLLEKSQENDALQAELAAVQEKAESLEEELNDMQQNLHLHLKEKESMTWELENKNAKLESSLEALEKSKKAEVKALSLRVAELTEQGAVRDSEFRALKDTIDQLRGDGGGVDTKALYDVGHVKAELARAVTEKEALQERLSDEEGARKLLEDHVKSVDAEVSSLRSSYESAEKDKLEAETRLSVLSNYFKEKETQLQKELGLQEAMWVQRQGDDTTVYERMKSLQEEVESYKAQSEVLKKEILNQERGLKGQIATLEKKAHENWVAARHAERRLEESKQEAGQLRNMLTLMEKSGDADSKSGPRHPGELNGEDCPLPPLLPDGTSPLPLPMLPLDPMAPPPMLPPGFMPPFMPPPGGFIPPPPFHPGDRRPPPLGRMSSPPLNRFSPAPPGDFGYDRMSPPPLSPPVRHYRSHRSPPSPWDEPPAPRSSFRPVASQRESRREYQGAHLSSGHSSSESLDNKPTRRSKV